MSDAPLTGALRSVTERIIERSRETRADYLGRVSAARSAGPGRAKLSCANWAHAFAASPASDRLRARDGVAPNIGIVTAYNDMLSAHQPFEHFPDIIRAAARSVGATSQVAGGVPAMCDGVTQGRPGMELSLFSRDVIALATAIALSHDAFDAALALGVCDKIVPGLVIGALSFGHLPVLFVPAGPMESGASNAEKSHVRALYAEGKADRAALLDVETRSYHGPGTCTFYGTANTNQMLMELMGLHVPGSAFVHPGTRLRRALTEAAARRAAELAASDSDDGTLGRVLDERAFVNGMVGLMATGGSTNLALHLVAMARAAGILIDWTDLDDLSAATPLMARVYPNGSADVNAFHAAGGLAFVVRDLLSHGMLHRDVNTVAGHGLGRYAAEPYLFENTLSWRDGPPQSLDRSILRGVEDPFAPEGGLKLLSGPLGRAVIKISAVTAEHRVVEAPAIVFENQDELQAAFKRGELDRDFVAVVRFQGPKANGMPELHGLTPALTVLQGRGRHVALVTDGRMSGASGKIPAAIHLSPEAADGGPLARVRDGDIIRLDGEAGTLTLLVDPAAFAARAPAPTPPAPPGFGRELFGFFRGAVGAAEAGASVLF